MQTHTFFLRFCLFLVLCSRILLLSHSAAVAFYCRGFDVGGGPAHRNVDVRGRLFCGVLSWGNGMITGAGRGGEQASIEEGPGVDDLIVLTHLHEPAILYTLHQRYIEDVIYTYTGPILLAINPFWRVPL